MKATLILGECMDFMDGCGESKFDLAICDPDFGLNDKIASGGTWASKYNKGDGDLGGKPNYKYFKTLFNISANQIIWGGNYFILPASRCFLVWDKMAKMDTLADCEYAWTSFDRNAKIFEHCRNTSEKRIHITQKPIKLYKWLLRNYAKQGDTILDTHGGSMSSVIACMEMGFDITCIEKDEDYFNEAVKRVQRHIGQGDMFRGDIEIEIIKPTT